MAYASTISIQTSGWTLPLHHTQLSCVFYVPVSTPYFIISSKTRVPAIYAFIAMIQYLVNPWI